MAKVEIGNESLRVRLSWLEKFLAMRRNVRVPLGAVATASSLDHPLRTHYLAEVRMGFTARSAPNQGILCVGPRATWRDGKALLVVYMNRRSVVIELEPNPSGYALLIVSTRDADDIARRLAAA